MLERFRERGPWSLPALMVSAIIFFIGLTPNPRESLVRVLMFSAAVLLITALAWRQNWRFFEQVVRLREELESWAGDLEEFEVDGGGDHKN